MRLPPLEVMESWPTPNYDNPKTHGPANVIVTLVLFGLVCIIVGLRMYTRICISKNLGLDDWLILVAFIPTTAFTITSLLIEETWGWNRHVWDMPFDSISFGLKYVLVTEFLFSTSAAFTKLSMLSLIYRIMGGSRRIGFFIKSTFALIVALWIALGFALVFQCRPPSDYWKLTLDVQPNCVSEPVLLLTGGILNTVTDMLVVLLPMPKVWKLQLHPRETMIVVILFGAGILVTIAGAVRTFYTYQISGTYDKAWVLYYVWISASVELYVGIICACIPATKKFFSRYIPILLKSNSLHRANSAVSDPNHNFYPIDPSLNFSNREIPIEMNVTDLHPSNHESFDDHKPAAKMVSFDTATTLYQPNDAEISGNEITCVATGVMGVSDFDFQFEYVDPEEIASPVG